MNALHYVNGIRTKVVPVSGHEFLSYVEIAERLTICTISSVFVVHTGTPEVIYYDGLTEAEANEYYTMLLAPYSHIADNKDDNDIFVDAANVHLYNFANRLKAYLTAL
jgi:hypothetical protein